MKLIDEGYIFDAEKVVGAKRVCFCTSLFQSASGKILATFRLGSSKSSADGNCAVAQSTDNGASWQIICDGFETSLNGVPGEIREAELAETGDGMVLAFLTWMNRSGGDESLYDAETDSVIPSNLLMARSTDGGQTWRDYQTLNTGSLTGPVLTGPTIRLPGKGWLAPFENFQHEQAGGPSLHGAHALFSADGESFDTVLAVARHPENILFYWDQRNRVCPKTVRVVTMFWTYDHETEKDVEIHMAWGDPATLTWEEPFATGITGQIAGPIPLPDGRLLAFYVCRQSPGSMRLIASPDGGKRWDHDGELVVYEAEGGKERSAGSEPGYAELWEDMGKWCFGHPSGLVLDDNTVLLTYYAGKHDKCLSGRWARVRI